MEDRIEKIISTTDPDIEFKKYVPSQEQLDQLATLFELVDRCKQSGIDICIVGGYGLDALYGKLTRDHGDIDLLIPENKLRETRTIVEEMGFIEDTTDTDKNKNLYRPNNNSKLPNSFKIEFGSIGAYNKFFSSETPLESIIPKNENGSLMEKPIRTLTLEGHKIAAEVLKKRAKEGKWGEYKHQNNFEKMVRILSQDN